MAPWWLLIPGFVLVFGLKSAMPAPSSLQQYNSIGYLSKYGYLASKDPRTGDLRSTPELVSAIRSFQRYAGLSETGKLDAATIAKMGEDRCGVADFGPGDSARRKRRYDLHGTRWEKTDLTYKVTKYTSQLQESDQRRIFKTAFDKWAAVTNLKVQEANNQRDEVVDILISFVQGYHTDAYPFDGVGGTLAHAFYPLDNKGLAGDAHFDDSEPFTTGSNRGINLDWVAIHEFGHSLGLQHSSVRDSVMYPWYKGYVGDIQLHSDDVDGIQELYGKKTLPTQTPPAPTGGVAVTTPPKLPEETDVCGMPSYDTFFMGADGKTYALKGDQYWVIASSGGLESGPHPIADKWKELATPVNAAYTRKQDSRTFFFVGSQYYEYHYSNLKRGPRPMSDLGLPDELHNMDAVFTWRRNTKTYFFKGDQYWRYYNNKVDLGYPKKISVWGGIPEDISAVMVWRNGKTYFFKGREYYRFDDWKIHAEAEYPQRIAIRWMKCEKEDLRGVTLPPTTTALTNNSNGDYRQHHHAESAAHSTLLYTQLLVLLPLAICRIW